ncbi:substrate-binding domain-containing protein [Solitalea koreensis]|nr:ABC transporter substrate-binding protein [Solitalea koreensis]
MQNLSYLLGEDISADQKEELETRIDIIQHKLKYVTDKPLVAIVEQLEPLKLAGLNAEMIDLAGGKLTEVSGETTWEELALSDPEIVVIALPGKTIEQHLALIGDLFSNSYFMNLYATKGDKVYLANGTTFYNAKGETLVDHLELMAEIINPKQFHFGFEGSGWVKFNI